MPAGILLLMIVLLPGALHAHAVVPKPISQGVGLEVRYDDGTPMSDADVTIYAPGLFDKPFLKIRTDPNGRFLFVPDRAGQWKMEVDDGLGHGTIETVDVQEALSSPPCRCSTELPRWQKVLSGVSLIFGLTGLITLLLAKKRHAHP